MAWQDEIDALKAQVAALSARLRRLEQQVAAERVWDEQIIPPESEAAVSQPAGTAARSEDVGQPAASEQPFAPGYPAMRAASAEDAV